MPTPQADTVTGYLTTEQASARNLKTAFTPNEETALANFTLNPLLVFPFLSSQWKPNVGESFLFAHFQSACDSTATVRYLDKFYTNAHAHGRRATALGCAHISVTCDTQMVNI